MTLEVQQFDGSNSEFSISCFSVHGLSHSVLVWAKETSLQVAILTFDHAEANFTVKSNLYLTDLVVFSFALSALSRQCQSPLSSSINLVSGNPSFPPKN